MDDAFSFHAHDQNLVCNTNPHSRGAGDGGGAGRRQTMDAPSALPECYYFTGNGMMGADQYTCKHGALVHGWQYADMKGGFRKGSQTFRPSPPAWSRFWNSLDAAGAWKWQRYYRPKINAEDGTRWIVELHHAHRTVKSQGYNASPRSFDLFVRALERLMDDARKHPSRTQSARQSCCEEEMKPIIEERPFAFAVLKRGLDWWAVTDSNCGPPACKAGALTS